MKKSALRILITVITAVISVACSDDEPAKPNPNPPAGDEGADRTVLVYMVADNNLGNTYDLDDDDLDEMEEAARAGDTGRGRLLVYHNRPGTNRGEAPQLLEITASGRKVLKDYPNNSGIYSVEVERMREVLADVKTAAPAESYGLVLWGHATGWMTDADDIREPSRSYGNDRGRWMSLSSLRSALEGEHFDFIYLDCCLMGTVEVVYELRDAADVIAGSPTEVEGEGMPYQLNVKPFFAREADIVAAARNTYEYHAAGGRTCQMVVVNTSALPALASASRDIYATVSAFPAELAAIQQLSQRFDPWKPPFTDCRPVYDFESYMQLCGAASPEALARWQQAYDSCIMYKATTETDFTGILIRTYGGLGSFIIKQPTDADYRGYRQTLWWADAASAAPAFGG